MSEKWTLRELSDYFGVGLSTVYNRLRGLNVTFRPPGSDEYVRYPFEREVAEEYSSGMRVSELARQYGISKYQVNQILARNPVNVIDVYIGRISRLSLLAPSGELDIPPASNYKLQGKVVQQLYQAEAQSNALTDDAGKKSLQINYRQLYKDLAQLRGEPFGAGEIIALTDRIDGLKLGDTPADIIMRTVILSRASSGVAGLDYELLKLLDSKQTPDFTKWVGTAHWEKVLAGMIQLGLEVDKLNVRIASDPLGFDKSYRLFTVKYNQLMQNLKLIQELADDT